MSINASENSNPSPIHTQKDTLLRPTLPWVAIIGLAFITVAFLALGLGRLLNVVFPAGSLMVGILLFWRYPILYIGFSWWLFFLTPLIRRLADMQGGFTNPSPILLAPFLVCMLTYLTVIHQAPKICRGESLPFIVAFLAVIYGFFLGLIHAPIIRLLIGIIDWLTPISYGLHLCANWQLYPLYKKNIGRVFTWGSICMGAYGIYQYLIAPPWDRFWLISHFDMSAERLNLLGSPFGTPQPFGIRVWSTMNGPLDFSIVMMGILFVILVQKTPFTILSSVLGYLAFLLTLARTAWLAWLIGIPSMIFRMKLKLQMRIVTVSLCIVAFSLPLALQEPFYSVIQTRVETIINVAEDGSSDSRQETYQLLFMKTFANFLGDGIGTSIGIDRPMDSSILLMLFHLGWAGTIPYFGSMLAILAKTSKSAEKNSDPFLLASQAIVIGSISVFLLGPIILGVTGVTIWTFLGISMAGKKYYQELIPGKC